MEWQLRNYEQAPYYNYPETGYEYGINLDDVVSWEVPFVDLQFDEQLEIGEGPYTARDIWTGTTFLGATYAYDTVLDLIEPDDEDQGDGSIPKRLCLSVILALVYSIRMF